MLCILQRGILTHSAFVHLLSLAAQQAAWVARAGLRPAHTKFLSFFAMCILSLLLHPPCLQKAWEVMESLYKNDTVEAIGLRDPTLGQLVHLITHRQYMDPAVVSVEVHPYHPFEHLVDFCKEQVTP